VGLQLWSLASSVSEDSRVTEGQETVMQQLYKGQKAVVVGGGPAGLVSAAYLAKHGFSVKVFERREDIRLIRDTGQRAYSIVLFGSSSDVLADVGVDLPSPEGGFKSGMHVFEGACGLKPDGSLASSPATAKNKLIATRTNITLAILSAIEKQYMTNVDIKFNHLCKSVSFKDQKITFETAKGNEVVVDYDLLVAADGSNSVVRKELQQFDRSLRVRRGPATRSYVSVNGLRIPDKNDAFSESLKPGWLGLGMSGSKISKKYAVALLYGVNPDGHAHAFFGGKTKFFEDMKGNEADWIRACLTENIPQDWQQGILQRIETMAIAKTPTWTYVSKLNGPRTVLIGDAAHAVSPSTGFGCNMAVTDGTALSDALSAANGDVSLVPQKFHSLRYHTVRSYQQIDEGLTSHGAVGWMALWHFTCTKHRNYSHLLQRVFSNKRHPETLARLSQEQISPIEAVNIIKRDALVALVVITGTLYALFRHIILPAAKKVIFQFLAA